MTDQPQEEPLDPEALWRAHRVGEPMTLEEVEAVVTAGITARAPWQHRGGGLYWNLDVWPDDED
jgi:hypothetical protein